VLARRLDINHIILTDEKGVIVESFRRGNIEYELSGEMV
jgi:hypothetical protein